MTLNSKNILLNTRNYKTYKILYKHELLKNYLLNNTVLFFYYDILTFENEIILKKIIQQDNLILLKIKKNTILNTFSKNNYLGFKNILTNNCLIITSNDKKKFLEKNFLKTIVEIKNIHCMGIWLNNNFYRFSEYNKLLNLSENSIKKPIFILKKQLIVLKNTISLKKNY